LSERVDGRPFTGVLLFAVVESPFSKVKIYGFFDDGEVSSSATSSTGSISIFSPDPDSLVSSSPDSSLSPLSLAVEVAPDVSDVLGSSMLTLVDDAASDVGEDRFVGGIASVSNAVCFNS
jgi:hypothetical protein